MIREHKPYLLKLLDAAFERWYTRQFVAPHFESLGHYTTIMKPWNIDIHGAHIKAGNNLHVITAKDRRVSFSTWHFASHQGHIMLGDNCLICPGVRLDSASRIIIGDNCMLAAGSYITDADWHDIYDRTQIVGRTRPVRLHNNVWIGDGATLCKGVTIGANAVVGAGAVVASDVAANTIVAGNPARVLKQLNPHRTIVTRARIFEDSATLARQIDQINRHVLGNNTWLGWIRSAINPRKGD